MPLKVFDPSVPTLLGRFGARRAVPGAKLVVEKGRSEEPPVVNRQPQAIPAAPGSQSSAPAQSVAPTRCCADGVPADRGRDRRTQHSGRGEPRL